MSTTSHNLKLVIGLDDRLSSALSSFESKMSRLQKKVEPLGKSLLGIGAASVAGLGISTRSAIAFEEKMADIEKTTGLSSEALSIFGGELLGLSKGTRSSVSSLQEIAVIAGQLGIAQKDLLGFTSATDKLNVALGDEFAGGAEEITDTLGKLTNIFQDIQTGDVEGDLLRIGNALNVLGAEGLATAPIVSDFAGRMGGVLIPLGLGTDKVLGLSAALQELAVEPERGASAVVTAFSQMGKKAEEFAHIAGVPVKRFIKTLDTDMFEAFKLVIEGFNELDPTASQTGEILDELGLGGIRTTEIFTKLSSNMGLVESKVSLAGEALLGTGSIIAEFNTKNQTTLANLEKLKNQFTSIAIVVGSALLPILSKIAEKASPIIEKVANWVSNNQTLTASLLVFGSALGGVGAVLLLVAPIVTALAGALTVLLSPIALIIGGLTALGGGLLLSGSNFTSFSEVVAFAMERARSVFETSKVYFLQAFETLNQLKDIAVFIFGGIRDIITNNFSLIKSVFFLAVGVLLAKWKGVWQIFSGTVKIFSSMIKGDWSALWQGLQTVAFGFFNFFIGGVGKKFLGGILKKIIAFLPLFAKAGKALALGIAKGVTSKIASVLASVSNLAWGALGRLRSILGIASPSKEGIKVGGFLIDGITKGVQSTIKGNAFQSSFNPILQPLSPVASSSIVAPTASPQAGNNISINIKIGSVDNGSRVKQIEEAVQRTLVDGLQLGRMGAI